MEYYDKKDMMLKLTDAVGSVFSQCMASNEYYLAKLAVVEFLTAISLSQDDAIEVMKNAQGMDAISDQCLDELIEEFSE